MEFFPGGQQYSGRGLNKGLKERNASLGGGGEKGKNKKGITLAVLGKRECKEIPQTQLLKVQMSLWERMKKLFLIKTEKRSGPKLLPFQL